MLPKRYNKWQERDLCNQKQLFQGKLPLLPRVLKDVFHEKKFKRIKSTRSRGCLIWSYFRVWTLNYLWLYISSALCVHGEEEVRTHQRPALFFIRLLSCILPSKAVLSIVALELWTRIMIGRPSLWGDAISHAQQSCLGSSQIFASPKAIGSQFKCCWLPQEIWLGCWWHTRPDWAGAGIKHAPNYSWHINFLLRIRYTSCYFSFLKCSHSCVLVPELRRKIANMVLLRLAFN